MQEVSLNMLPCGKSSGPQPETLGGELAAYEVWLKSDFEKTRNKSVLTGCLLLISGP